MYKRTPIFEEFFSYFTDSENLKSDLTYLRGRRRIGKSTLLKSIAQKLSKRIFYFTGNLDEPTLVTIRRFILEWESFSGEIELSQYKTENLTWNRIFGELDKFICNQKQSVGLIFDEIQWIAKPGNGFIGSLKSAWLDFEVNKKTKIILCGSSNKFFNQYTGGEEQILRGVKTRSEFWLKPLSCSEIKKYYLADWTKSEIIFLQMMLGGIPYYLNQIAIDKPFLQALNEAFFCPSTIFLTEVDEILRMEFNKSGINSVKKIMTAIGSSGKTIQRLIETSRMPTATVDSLLNKLIEYNLIEERMPALEKIKANRRGVRMYIKDSFLIFYFSVLKLNKVKIEKNLSQRMILTDLMSSKGLYIPNFTGSAFEHFVIQLLREGFFRKESIFKKLYLKNEMSFDVGSHWSKEEQIDVVVFNCEDRVVRLIECKWTFDPLLIKESILKLNQYSKEISFQMKIKVMSALVTPLEKISNSLEKWAVKNNVILITAKDLV